MVAKLAVTLSSGHPDPKVLRTLIFVRRVCLLIIVLIAMAVLLAWIVPGIDWLMPVSWHRMKVNTAICLLFLSLSLQLGHAKRTPRADLLNQAFAIATAVISFATLYQYLRGINLHIDILIAADPWSSIPGRMSPQSAIALLMLALATLYLRARKSILSHIADALTTGIVLFMMVLLSGYFFGATRLFGLSTQNRISPQTLLCLSLLTILVFNERTHFGLFSIFTSDSIAGKTFRLATPFALGLPFMMEVLRATVVKLSWLQYEYATAFATSSMALLAFCLIYIISRRIQSLERSIHDLSLRDDLTGLYNRRGFYVLATQALRLAQRLDAPYSVIFMDMDNLKHVNDTLGHEVGSELLREMAAILTTNFREIDIIGRLGGDEFVVAANASTSELNIVLQRLEGATQRANSLPGRPYSINFSYGHATSETRKHQTLDELLGDADTIMYQTKREKRKPFQPIDATPLDQRRRLPPLSRPTTAGGDGGR
jgi:diguanylate cyclase (GGDEF)-like protein